MSTITFTDLLECVPTKAEVEEEYQNRLEVNKEIKIRSAMRDVLNEIEEIGGIDDDFSDFWDIKPAADDEEESEDEETEPYCFKDTTIDTVNTDVCFCSVGGCVKPTEFD